jgi:hypothetical protein
MFAEQYKQRTRKKKEQTNEIRVENLTAIKQKEQQVKVTGKGQYGSKYQSIVNEGNR